VPEAPTTAASDPGERRFVSVLFADLVGFTTFSESRDPEEVRAMLTRYFDRAREVIERFGGEVDKFIGDAVTAFWGAKQTEEDDAERAVRAALELVDAVEALGEDLGIPELAVRAGVLSGETSVGVGGNEKGLVVGDIVNTASRLQSAADPGAVFVGDSTKQLSDAAIRYELVGEQDMKGKSVPVTAWRAHSIVGERGGKNRWGTLEPPFVGRDDELRLLKDQLHATTRDGTARLVSIVGEAGIGKSRLAWELLKYLDGLSEVFRWHQGRSPAYGEGVTFWALTEMVRSRAGIAETDEPLKARTKLRTVVAEFVPDIEEQQWIEPRLAGLLGLDEMPSGDRNELFAALRTFFQRVAANETAVLLFEDLHWADDGQLEFVEELVEMSKNHPILVITLARPELLERHPGWGSARQNFLSTHLGPLSDTEMNELLTGLVPGISEQMVDLIVERAGGVPLYAVEYVRMLINSGDLVLDGSAYRETGDLTEVALPDSLHAMVGARLDRLDEQSRSLVQDAAVLGQSFTVEGMTVLTGQSVEELEPKLRELARQELIHFATDPRSPERGQYQFVQSVIKEVAYGRIAKADRKDRHLRVAEYYTAEAPVEAAAVIASHYMNAYEAGPEDELADKARGALVNAAQRAIELKSYAQALSLVEQAIEVPGSEAQQAALWELAAPSAAALFRHEDSVSYAQRALDWYLEHGSPTDIVRGAQVLGTAYVDTDEPVNAVEAMAPYFDAERAGEPEMMALGAELSRAQMRSFKNQESADVALAVLMAAEASGSTEMVVEAMNTRGTVLGGLGRVFESLALLREALRLAELHGLPYPTLRALNNLATVGVLDGIASQRDGWARGYELAQRVMHGALLVRMASNYATGLFEDGEFDEAIAVLDEFDLGESVWADFFAIVIEQIRWIQTGDPVHIERARQANDPLLKHPEPQYHSGAVDTEIVLLWMEGRLDEVIELAPQVVPAQPYHQFRHLAIGSAVRLGDADKVRAAIDLIELPIGRRYDVLRFAGETALELLEGDPDRAAAMFGQLIDQLAEVESPRFAAEWKAIFAEVMPDRPEAKVAAQEAYDWFSKVGAQGYLDLYSRSWGQLGEQAAAG
jgi:class 3 adenylate cyclase/tetratricopeptide (TPR) repeat protein